MANCRMNLTQFQILKWNPMWIRIKWITKVTTTILTIRWVLYLQTVRIFSTLIMDTFWMEGKDNQELLIPITFNFKITHKRNLNRLVPKLKDKEVWGWGAQTSNWIKITKEEANRRIRIICKLLLLLRVAIIQTNPVQISYKHNIKWATTRLPHSKFNNNQ
jgi:hypothetical protein